jgi:two-component system chemotaxis sensor kinase CheA
VSALHAVIEGIMNSPGSGSAPAPVPAPAPAPLAMPADVRSGWRIHFIPGPKLLRNGNDPLRLLRELATLAPCEVRVDAKWIPPLTELDPEECRLSWRIELNGPVKEAAIKSVFDWVEGECDLNIEAFGPAAESVAAAPAAAPAPAVPAGRRTPCVELRTRRGSSRRPQPTTNSQAVASAAALPSAAAGEGGSIRVSIEKIDELLNSVGELVITQSVLSQLAAPLEGREAEEMRSALGQLERHMRALQESVMRVRMLPISFVFNRFPRLVRDLASASARRSSCAHR